jgi:hypothetical protein
MAREGNLEGVQEALRRNPGAIDAKDEVCISLQHFCIPVKSFAVRATRVNGDEMFIVWASYPL